MDKGSRRETNLYFLRETNYLKEIKCHNHKYLDAFVMFVKRLKSVKCGEAFKICDLNYQIGYKISFDNHMCALQLHESRLTK